MAEDKQGLRWKVTKAVRRSKLPSPSKLIMLTLADIADVGTAEIPERWTPSLTVLADETGLGRSTVAAHLRALETAGWLIRTRPATGDALGRFERTRYQLCVAPSADAGLVQEIDRPGSGLPSAGARQPSATPEPPSAGAGHRNRSSSDQGLISSDHFSPATPPKANKTTKRVTDDDPDFAAFWKSYPRKTGKGHARTAWASALKVAEPAAIISGAEKFAGWCSRSRTEQRYIPHPATWLRGERWSDEAETDRQPTRNSNGHRPFMNPTDEDAYGGTL